jgi:hypothetical protein
MKDLKGQSIESYLEEGLLALYPVYDNGDKSAVLTRKGRHTDPRSTVWLIRKMASYYNLDLVSLRRECRDVLQIRHHIALAFTRALILLPVKVRQAEVPGETTNGFVNMLEIKKLLPATTVDKNPWLSRVVFENGKWIKTCNTVDTIRQRQKHGNALLEAFAEKFWYREYSKYFKEEELDKLLTENKLEFDELLYNSFKLTSMKLLVLMGYKIF